MSRADGRLYKAEWVHDAEENYDHEMYGEPLSEPAGWREYALERWGNVPRAGEHWPNGYKPFFWPATDRIFRSRSAAQRRVDIINAWGGRAVVLECTPQWETVSAANARRKARRLREKRARVIEMLDAVNVELRAVEVGD